MDRVDHLQRRHTVLGFPLAVVYKFFDDQGNYLAAVITYYGVLAIVPLLLIASSVLGFVLQGDSRLAQHLLNSALSQFPIVGTEIRGPQGLTGSTSSVVFGGIAALYGVLGLGQAAQNAVNTVWAVPRNSRLNPILARLSSVLLLIAGGLTVLAVTVFSSVVNNLEAFGAATSGAVSLLINVGTVLLTAAVLAAMMRLATTQRQRLLAALPGALTVAVGWQVLQSFGGDYVSRVVSRATELNAFFAIVLGLIALIYIAAVIAVIGLEINVVLARRLWPRALLTPFTDAVELTEADERAYAGYAKAQRHKGFEEVDVSFEDHED